jgi:hypothetical protein
MSREQYAGQSHNLKIATQSLEKYGEVQILIYEQVTVNPISLLIKLVIS